MRACGRLQKYLVAVISADVAVNVNHLDALGVSSAPGMQISKTRMRATFSFKRELIHRARTQGYLPRSIE